MNHRSVAVSTSELGRLQEGRGKYPARLHHCRHTPAWTPPTCCRNEGGRDDGVHGDVCVTTALCVHVHATSNECASAALGVVVYQGVGT